MHKLGLATDLPPTDREAFEKYLTAFADPLTPSKQEALQMLFSPDFDPVAMNRLGRAGGGGSVVGRARSVAQLLLMLSDNCLVWNVRGLNGRERRNVVRDLVSQECASLVCLQETKLSNICNPLANDILGGMFDYDFVPSLNAAGGILLGWHREHWVLSEVDRHQFFISAKVAKVVVPVCH
jgi:hypothetical protein